MEYANCYQHLELFLEMSDARATANGITHISEKNPDDVGC